MKAVRVNEFGGPEVLRWEDGVPEPSPGPGELLIKVAGAGMNFADQSRRRGTYPGGPAPTTLGMEAGGTVASVGPGASEFKVGDNVMARVAGAQAEYVAAREADVFPAPGGVDPVHAGGIPLVFLTAYHILRTRADVQSGETVLVHAAASGVGTAAIQLARHWGASVIATASTEEKLELARSLGAGHTINYANDDFQARVKEIAGDRGVEVILDSVGGDVLEKSMGCLGVYGRLITYGNASGAPASLSARDIFSVCGAVMGFSIGRSPDGYLDHKGAMAEMLPLFESGELRLVLDRTMPMSAVAEAHAHLANRGTLGKVILTP